MKTCDVKNSADDWHYMRIRALPKNEFLIGGPVLKIRQNQRQCLGDCNIAVPNFSTG